MDAAMLGEQALRRARAPEAPATLVFDAVAAGGQPLRLQRTGSARHAADAAIALDGLEELLAALDDWCGGALDWHWSPQARAVGTDAQLALRCGEGYVRLLCTWSWLRALAPPPAALAGRLRWPPVPVVVQAALLRLAQDDLARLEAGGAVVLPGSMQKTWAGALRAVDEALGAGIALEIGDPAAPRVLARPSAVAAVGAGEVACEVRLDAPSALAGDHLAGWRETVLDLAAFDGRAGLWRCAGADAPASRLATGRLMPCGDGWLLRLEQIET